MSSPPLILGVVLAGGASRRMGRDKAALLVGGRTLLERAVDRLAPQVAAVAISAGETPVAMPGLATLPDPLPGRAGPLAGLLAGMRWAAAEGAARVQLAPVDAPFFPRDLVARLAAAGDGVALPRSGGRTHPTFLQAPVALADDLAAFVAAGGSRAMHAWLDRHAAAVVDFAPVTAADGPVDPFFNLNTPDEAAYAERLAAGGRPSDESL